MAVLISLMGATNPDVGAGERSGEQIYAMRCAGCHGAAGEGGDEYPQPLIGTRSIGQLARYIQQSMPKDDPQKCSEQEAGKVAEFIYDRFYSPLAQARTRPMRVELARLTARQYRHSIADLIASFREPPTWDQEQGLLGEYFKSRRMRESERVAERRDAQIQFDFDDGPPTEGEYDLHQFSIRWQGAIIAPDTGVYEFVVRTDHAVKLWVNDLRQPLIDGWVKSGNDPVYREPIFLLGGRAYPLRLEFSKAKQGVDDSAKNKDKPPLPASIRLEWRLPGASRDTVLAERNLIPKVAPGVFALATPFPPDDRSTGYERGTAVSKEWDQATTAAALAAADYLSKHWDDITGTKSDASDRSGRARAFARQFAERAARRPLEDALRATMVDRYFQDGFDPDLSVKRAVLLTLKSPRFLFPELNDGRVDKPDASAVDSWRRAGRLALVLWDSLPDAELRRAAEKGELETPDQIRCQAERMAGDQRAFAKLREYLLQWVRAYPVPDLSKEESSFPEFDAAMAADLRTSLELFLDHVLRSATCDFRELMLADYLFLNGRLAQYYSVDLPPDVPFQRVSVAGERAGLITHPYLLAVFSYRRDTSPIHRGVFVARGLLGRTLRPPPDAFPPEPSELHPGLTTRERISRQTNAPACQKCHALINPLGFPLERFDAVGRLRDRESGKALDLTGNYTALTGEVASFQGPLDLARFVASSEEAQEAFVEHLFQNLVKQPVQAYGRETLRQLCGSFQDRQFHIRQLAVEIAVLEALRDDRSTDDRSPKAAQQTDAP
jgi:hypothetical protein